MARIRITYTMNGKGNSLVGDVELPNNINTEQGYKDFIKINLSSLIKEHLERTGIPYDIVSNVDFTPINE